MGFILTLTYRAHLMEIIDQMPMNDSHWHMRVLIEAIHEIEVAGICRCDLDCLAPSEELRLRAFLGVLQDYAHGYDEDGPQDRLSTEFGALLQAAEDRDDPFRGELSIFRHDQLVIGLNAPLVEPALAAVRDMLATVGYGEPPSVAAVDPQDGSTPV